MHRTIYNFVFYMAVPLILLRLLLRSIRAPQYRRRIGERFALARTPANFDSTRQTIWIHAVSVGETVAAQPLVRELQLGHPQCQILITTMTPTGSARVKQLFDDSVFHCYMPYDIPAAVRRFIAKFNPSLLIIMETELWPNTIHQCHREGVKLVLANARLSQKSARAYGRISALTADMLGKIDCIAAQAEADAERFLRLGASKDRLEVTGSLKFNVAVDESESLPDTIFESILASSRTVWVAASTRDGEEAKLIAAFKHCLVSDPDLLLLLVPRHPERFDKVAKLCTDAGLETGRRSRQQPLLASTQVYLGDSMGEMLAYYRVADIAFVGGSLVDTGCQNVLEPAALSLPIVVGPSQFNFASICAQLELAGALKTVVDEIELAAVIVELATDKARQRRMGLAAKELVAANQNALPAILRIVEPFISD